MTNRKELTLEELIVKEKEGHEKRKEFAANNVQKIEQRAAEATGDEKTRLEALAVLHKKHQAQLKKVTKKQLETSVKEKFEKRKPIANKN
jgi:HEAT repeat protein